MSSEFVDRRVLVTGGANGLGRAIVQKFYENGATVFTMDFDEAALQQLKIDFPQVTTIQVDLSDWEATRISMESILPIHHLVNNAAVYQHRGLMNSTDKDIDFAFGVNFKAPFNLTQVFANGIKASKFNCGTVVNISSIVDRFSVSDGSGIYSTTKAALTMLTKAAAFELGQYNIRVNCIRPTGMPTNMFVNALADDPEKGKKAQTIVDRAVIKSTLQTSDAANLVFFLSSSQSSIITGEDVAIDGGVCVS